MRPMTGDSWRAPELPSVSLCDLMLGQSNLHRNVGGGRLLFEILRHSDYQTVTAIIVSSDDPGQLSPVSTMESVE